MTPATPTDPASATDAPRYPSGSQSRSQPEAVTSSRARLSERRRRILLAEDDADMRELLAWSLIDQGYEVVEVDDGMDLCRRLADHLVHKPSHHFDLVISDIRMPGVTGLEVIRGLRELEHVPPTILITAFGDEEIHRQANEIGVLLLDKPFEIDDLLARVREVLRS